jgi:hypothetical protein
VRGRERDRERRDKGDKRERKCSTRERGEGAIAVRSLEFLRKAVFMKVRNEGRRRRKEKEREGEGGRGRERK